jgi:hypothetical protein
MRAMPRGNDARLIAMRWIFRAPQSLTASCGTQNSGRAIVEIVPMQKRAENADLRRNRLEKGLKAQRNEARPAAQQILPICLLE